MQLHELLDHVDGPESFLEFVKVLRADWEEDCRKPATPYGAGANGWENGTIGAFLEAGHAWAEASKFGSNQDLKDASPWRLFATFLYCGKIYE